MTFELESFTEVHVHDVRTLTSKDRKPDELPGAQLLVSALLPAEYLSMLDPSLTTWLFRKASSAAQGKLEGMEGHELTEAGKHVPRMPWAYEQTGVFCEIDRGLGDKKSNIELEDCKMHRVSLQPQQSGGARLQWTVDAPSLSDATRGKLSGLKSTKIKLKLLAPTVDDGQTRIDDDPPPAGKPEPKPQEAWPFPDPDKRKQQSAADAFAANEKAGKNKPASQVPQQPRQRRASANRPSLKAPVE